MTRNPVRHRAAPAPVQGQAEWIAAGWLHLNIGNWKPPDWHPVASVAK